MVEQLKQLTLTTLAQFFVSIVCFVFVVLSSAQAGAAEEEYSHPGYLQSVEEEKYQVTREVVIVPYSEPDALSLRDKIFTEKLTKEFRKEYEDRFGRTETEQLENVSNRFVETSESGRLVPYNEHIEEQEKFGNFMLKELTEHHVDAYLRSGRNTRKIYEVKEKISNVNVNMAQGYKLKLRYKLSSNTIEMSADKPKQRFHNRVVVNLGNVSDFEDAQLYLNYDVTKKVQLISNYTFTKDIYTLGVSREMGPNLRTSITGQKYGKSFEDIVAQERILFGLTWSD